MNEGYLVRDEDGREYGPIDVDTLRRWYSEGRVSSADRVQRLPDNVEARLDDFFDLTSWEFFEERASFLDGRVRVVVGDLTKQRVDAIVNAANSSLMGGGGVDGAVHEAGGSAIVEECKQIRRTRYPAGLPTGEAVITTGGGLPARFVIHTVGPIRGQVRHESELLAACYRNALALAVSQGLRSVAFPAISTGVYSYPRAEAAAIASRAVREFLSSDDSLQEVRLVFNSAEDADVFLKYQLFRPSSGFDAPDSEKG